MVCLLCSPSQPTMSLASGATSARRSALPLPLQSGPGATPKTKTGAAGSLVGAVVSSVVGVG